MRLRVASLTLALGVTFAARVEAVPILVSADATVAGGLFAGDNFGDSAYGGGLLTGLEGSEFFGPYRFYLMFALPAFTANTFVQSAVLRGFYSDDWDTFDDRTHSFYRAPSTWTESTITWNNQPGSAGGALGAFNAAQATLETFQSWNITAAVNAAYLGQNPLFSLLFRADNEALGTAPVINNNLEFFASREFAGGAQAFRIDVDIAQVPEAGTLTLVALALAGALARRRARVQGFRSSRVQ